MTGHRKDVWTDERVAQLESLWAKNYSAGRCALEMDCGFTRNAIIGKVHRLGLDHRKNSYGEYTVRAPNKPRLKPAGRPKETLHIIPTAPEILEMDNEEKPYTFLGIPLLKLQENHCRYPRTVEGVHLFCGQEKMRESSYCRSCHRLCHSAAQSPNRYGFSGSWMRSA